MIIRVKLDDLQGFYVNIISGDEAYVGREIRDLIFEKTGLQYDEDNDLWYKVGDCC